MRNFLIILSTLSLLGCNPLANNEEEDFKDITVKELTYSHLEGMSGDIFKFNLETNNDLNNRPLAKVSLMTILDVDIYLKINAYH
ncbi:hypothetical protein [Acinetobacter baumannii]|uniref:hypothetical protein n=1 Tax=Acinetobacter baumannii TaxID=470 RepID=UPI003892337D